MIKDVFVKPKLPLIVDLLFCVWNDIQSDQKMAAFWKKKGENKKANTKIESETIQKKKKQTKKKTQDSKIAMLFIL